MARPDEEGEKVRSYRLEGRVQGVGFRWWTERTAGSLGLRGWVRNLPDGAVEVHAAGRPAALEQFARRLRNGPRAARVDAVRELGPASELPRRGFEVRY